MTFAQVAGLGVRLFALWLFLFSIQALASAFALKNNFGDLSAGQTALVLAPVLVAITLGVFLWQFPLGVARILIPRGADKASDMTLREAWRLGSVLVGLMTLASAAPSVLRMLALMLLASDTDFDVPMEIKSELVFSIAKTAFGLLLVFGSELIYRRFSAAPQQSAGGDVR